MPEQLTTADPRVTQELAIVTSAMEVALGVKELTVSFAKRRDELTTVAYAFTKPPEDEEQQNEILSAQRDVAKLRTELVKNADALKAPLNNAREKIIEITNNAVETLKKAELHCQGLVNNRQEKLRQARLEEERRVETERKRLSDQTAAAEREQAEAGRLRKAAAMATPDVAAALTQQAEALDADAYGKMLDAETAAIPAAVSAPAPQAREVADFALVGRTDAERKESLRRLLAAHPEFFTLEAKEETPRAFSLKLRIADLVDALNGRAPFAELKSAPGITISKKLTTLR